MQGTVGAVVVLAFGPRKVTRAAVDRARRFGAPVVVVPGLRGSSRGLGALRSSLVRVESKPGRRGLDEALASVGDPTTPTLLLHDDVLIGPDAVAELAGLHARGATVAVPATNEPETDAYVGALAPDVVPALADEPDREVRTFRPSCLVASAGDLRRLLVRRLASPLSVISLAPGNVVASGTARAVHLDACRDQLPGPEGPDGRPLLVASMIVRDEEELLGDALASLDGLVDRIELVDTGSVDRTIEIAREAGAVVSEIVWRDDFAWARNQAIERCRDAWFVLIVDADERVSAEDPVAFRRLLAAAVDDEAGFKLAYEDRLEDGVVPGQHAPRVFPATAVWVGKLHETPRQPDGDILDWTIVDEVTLGHLGYRPDIVAARDKGARNVALGRVQYKADPNAINAYQLSRSLQVAHPGVQLVPEAVELLLEVVEASRAGESGMDARARADTHTMLARHHLASDEPTLAVSHARDALAIAPDDPPSLAVHAQAAVAVGAFEEALEVAARAEDDQLGAVEQPHIGLQRQVALAKAHLGLEDLEGARDPILRGLALPPPNLYDEWDDLVALVALVAPEDADDRLRPWALSVTNPGLLKAIVRTFHPEDAAEFAVDVVRRLPPGDRALGDRAMLALAAVIVADRADLAEALLATGYVPPTLIESMAEKALEGGHDTVAAVLRRELAGA